MARSVLRLRPADVALLRDLLTVFAAAFDEPAVALYTKLGTRDDVMHFDIPVPGTGNAA